MKPADIKPDPISAGIIVTSGSRVFVPISSPENNNHALYSRKTNRQETYAGSTVVVQ